MNLYWLIEKPIAHRGFHRNDDQIPENSMIAFEQAIKHGFPIELDLHLSKDGKVMVFHDSTLKRMTGEEGKITDFTAEQLQQYMLLGSNYSIPLLAEVLEVVNGKVPLLIELKNSNPVGVLEEKVLLLLQSYQGLYAIQSFDPFTLEWFYHQAPWIPRGQLACNMESSQLLPFEKYMLQNLGFNYKTKPDFISYGIVDLPYWAVDQAKAKGLPILGWTARNKESFEQARQYCDNIIFEGFLPS